MSSLPHPDSFYVRLPSNVVTPDQTNTAWDFVVPLPHPLNFPEFDEWTVAVTSVFLPPLGKQTSFDNVFIYSDLVTGTLVGDIETPLLCTVDVKAETLDGVVGGVVREPEQLMHCPLRVGYIESIRLMLRDEFGKNLVALDRGQTVVALHFLKRRLAMGDRRLVLPSNASKDLYPDNKGDTFTVHLPAALNYVPDDWKVAMVYLTIPVPHGRLEALSPMRRVGVGWLKDHQWTIKGARWGNLPAKKYHSAEDLIREFNVQMTDTIQTNVPNVSQGSWVKSGQNVLTIYDLTYLKGSGVALGTPRKIFFRTGLYTMMELLEGLNNQFSMIKFHTVMLQKQIHVYCTHEFQVGADGKGHTQSFTVTFDSILRRLGWSNGNHDGGRAAFYKAFNTSGDDVVVQPSTTSVTKTLDVTEWVKIWMEVDLNTVVLKRWAIDPTLHLVLSSEMVDYFGFPKSTTDVKLGFRTTPKPVGPPASTESEWVGQPPMVVTGPTWTHPSFGDTPLPVEDSLPPVTLLRSPLRWADLVLGRTLASGIYVYTNIVDYSIVGNFNAPLLDIVPVGGEHGGRKTYEFRHPHYNTLRVSTFQDVDVYLRDSKGQSVDFGDGLVVVTLHIRPRQPER
ncbi:hypothetical protein QZH41_004037 [Actinostola sp. cb2023]|nr:hypothetical protein QZH41_004037 [Actinostola sp. cb2023]